MARIGNPHLAAPAGAHDIQETIQNGRLIGWTYAVFGILRVKYGWMALSGQCARVRYTERETAERDLREAFETPVFYGLNPQVFEE